jgi:NAD(P)-dependent dehydrogenase (short-subunit alcohol dehydrogenase family)
MKIKNSVALVTGANRGLGLALVHELLARGASKVYAGVRDLGSINIPGVVPIRLDVTNPQEIAAAVARCGDTTLVINNAGIARVIGYFEPTSVEVSREIFETNYYGPIFMSQAFAPVLAANGGGAVINVLSVASWISSTMLAPYAASKSAAWSFTNALRQHLREQGTQVLGLHVGFMDTDMTRGMDAIKVSPASVAQQTLAGLEAGLEEVLADEPTREVKQGLLATPPIYLQALAR